MTVVPRLNKAFASPSNSCSRSPCMPEGGGDWEVRGESGAGCGGGIGQSRSASKLVFINFFVLSLVTVTLQRVTVCCFCYRL
jgi:hypothetical protein